MVESLAIRRDGEKVAELADESWTFFIPDVEEAARTLVVFGILGVRSEGSNVVDEGGEVSDTDYRWAYALADLVGGVVVEGDATHKGGAGSGHHAHAGRPGKRGGSQVLPGYVSRRKAMEELGIQHSSRMVALGRYGLPTTKGPGGQLLVKWPEAKLWHAVYVMNGKGRKGVQAANAKLRKTPQPKPELPDPPGGAMLVTRKEAMSRLGVNHYSRMKAYERYGLPMEEGKVKWPEAETWMNTYREAGKGRKGVEAANAAVGSQRQDVFFELPKPPAPKVPKGEVVQEFEGRRSTVAPAVDPEKAADVWKGKSPTKVTSSIQGEYEMETVDRTNRMLHRLPKDHVASVDGGIHVEWDWEKDPVYGKNAPRADRGDEVAGYCVISAPKARVVVRGEYVGAMTMRSDRTTTLHEVGHGVHRAVFPSDYEMPASARIKAQGDAIMLGTNNVQRSLRFQPQLRGMYADVKRGQRNAVTEYAETNVKEYFASSYSAYVNFPRRLRAVDGEMYNWMKTNIFRGLEYD